MICLLPVHLPQDDALRGAALPPMMLPELLPDVLPEVLRETLRDAIAAARGAASVRDVRVFAGAGAEVLDLPGAAPLPAAPRPGPPHLPPGTSDALDSLTPAEAASPVMVLDFRCPGLTPALLDEAAKLLERGRHPLVLSAEPPAEHPCQARLAYRLLDVRPAGVSGSTSDGVSDGASGGTSGDVSGSASGPLIELHGPDGATILTLEPVAEGSLELERRLVPPGAPWFFDSKTGRLRSTATGEFIHGRQAFPALMRAEGTLAAARDARTLADPAPLAFEPLPLPAGTGPRVTDALSLLRAGLARRTP